ncbi:MAG TPA: gamma-glutamyltransferase [Parafilimonas sp.]|nr:gamma-glutamyltransferase [Parafilimonas sp.]
MKNLLFTVFSVNIVFFSCSPAAAPVVGPGKEVDPYHYSSTKSLTVKHGCVVSAHPLASEVGLAVLKRGGNAFDAMIATQLALAVVYPNAGNLGGGGFTVARTKSDSLIALDYRETAPSKGGRDMYIDSAGNARTDWSQNGHLSAGVPGTVAGLFAEYKYAKLPFKELIQPAIDLAEKGFTLTEREANSFNGNKEDFLQYNTKPTALVKNTEWKAGDTLFQPELSKTLKLIRDNDAKGFYEGETAKLIVEEMQRGKGLISYEDLKNYVCKPRKPVEFDYRGYHVVSMPPSSSGGIILGEMLKMIEPYPMHDYGFQTKQSVQLMIEAERRAYADRAEHLGDPDFWKVPQNILLSDAYLKKRMADYDSTKAGVSENIKAGNVHESSETTHISVIDEEGNMVAVTTTLNNSYGSKTFVGGAGFLLNDEMDDFSIKPGIPNMYGAIGGDANAIEPGKRMLSSMTPTLVLKDHKPFIVVGTPGGTTITTSVFQSIVNIVDFDMSARDAVDKPKFHHQWLPDRVTIESGFSESTAKQLEAMGYKLQETGGIGRTELIKILPDGTREAAADIRGDDSASGY